MANIDLDSQYWTSAQACAAVHALVEPCKLAGFDIALMGSCLAGHGGNDLDIMVIPNRMVTHIEELCNVVNGVAAARLVSFEPVSRINGRVLFKTPGRRLIDLHVYKVIRR